jgi:hypothetical protein
MVIICSDFGRLCNKLFLFSHFIANSLQHKYYLINPNFKQYSKYFNLSDTNKLRGDNIYINTLFNPIINIIIRRINKLNKKINSSYLHKIYSLDDLSNDIFDLNNKDYLKNIGSKKIVFINGWLFRDYGNILKFKDKIRKYFIPIEPYNSNIDKKYKELKTDNSLLVGIHVRRGDYETWNNGAYYFSDNTYKELIKRISDLLICLGKSVKFAIFSDEQLNKLNWANSKYNIEFGTGHFIEDLYLLSKCDYITGPPSTYSRWASYYGDVPLLHIYKKNQSFILDDFQIDKG